MTFFFTSFLFSTVSHALVPPAVDRVPEDFSSIQEAVSKGKASMISVGPGQWKGAQVNRPVQIVGRDAVIVDGPRVWGATAGFTIVKGGSGSEFRGLSFDCNSATLDMGIYSSNNRLKSVADHITVSGNVFNGCVQGVTNSGSLRQNCSRNEKVDGGQYWLIQDNTFNGFSTAFDRGSVGGGIGVFLYNAVGADVLENQFVGRVDDQPAFSTSGVFLAGCVDCTIALNDFAVKGGEHFWTAISNYGYYQSGAAPSRDLILSENNAMFDSAPFRGQNFRSYDSFGVDMVGNRGVAFVDHSWCGDQALSQN